MLIETRSKFWYPLSPDRDACGVRMPSKLLKQIGAGRKPIQQMIRLDTAPRAMGHVALDGKHHAGTIQPFRNLRGCNANDPTMPAFSRNDRHVRLTWTTVQLEFGYGKIDDLLLHLLPLLIASIKMCGEL